MIQFVKWYHYFCIKMDIKNHRTDESQCDGKKESSNEA